MNLDKLRDAELDRRRGLACRTLMQVGWLAISAVLAVFVAWVLFTAELLRYELFYQELGLPAAVPAWVVFTAVVILLVLVMQFLLLLGFFIATPGAWRRTGRPSAAARNPDPLDDDYFR